MECRIYAMRATVQKGGMNHLHCDRQGEQAHVSALQLKWNTPK